MALLLIPVPLVPVPRGWAAAPAAPADPVPADPVPADPVPAGLTEAPQWRWPLDGTPQVVRRFEPPATPYGPGHRGVDLASSPGAVVRAAGAGTVWFAGLIGGRGVVSIRHADGRRTTYEPVHVSVEVEAVVRAGTPLGQLAVGHPGCPVAACLHWGLLSGTTYQDPLSLLSPGRVRLYPD